MQELLNDPDTLPCLEPRVNLPLLKTEIDRRILKITTLLQGSVKVKDTVQSCIPTANQAIQTEDSTFTCSLNPLEVIPYSREDSVLTVLVREQRKEKGQADKENKFNKRRPLRQNRGSSRLYVEQEFLKEEPEFLDCNNFTFRRQNKTQLQEISQNPFNQKVPSNMKKSTIEAVNRNSFPNQLDSKDNPVSETGRMSLFTDLSGSSSKVRPRHNRFSFKAKSPPTEFFCAPVTRIKVSECIWGKMEGQVEQLVSKRRKEFWDSKIRLNMLKKIEERYRRELQEI